MNYLCFANRISFGIIIRCAVPPSTYFCTQQKNVELLTFSSRPAFVCSRTCKEWVGRQSQREAGWRLIKNIFSLEMFFSNFDLIFIPGILLLTSMAWGGVEPSKSSKSIRACKKWLNRSVSETTWLLPKVPLPDVVARRINRLFRTSESFHVSEMKFITCYDGEAFELSSSSDWEWKKERNRLPMGRRGKVSAITRVHLTSFFAFSHPRSPGSKMDVPRSLTNKTIQ